MVCSNSISRMCHFLGFPAEKLQPILRSPILQVRGSVGPTSRQVLLIHKKSEKIRQHRPIGIHKSSDLRFHVNCFPQKSQDQGTNPIQATKAPASGNATAAAGAKPVGRGNLCLNLTVSMDVHHGNSERCAI
jgi:hypothetical protein